MNISEKIFNSWNTPETIWFWIIPIGILIYIFSNKLVKSAEKLISYTKTYGGFIGVLFIAIISSTPELITQIIQSNQGTPAIAISNVLGSDSFIMLAIAIVSIIFFKKIFTKKMNIEIKVFVIILFFVSIIVFFALFFSKDISIGKKGIFCIGLISIALFAIYIATTFFSYKLDQKQLNNLNKNNEIKNKKKEWFMFFLIAIFLIIISILLNWIIDSFIFFYKIDSESSGGLFLSFATAMPEIIIFIKFIQGGYITAGFGSIFGAQILIIAQIFFGDLVYNAAPIFDNHYDKSLWYLTVILIVEIGLFILQFLFLKKIKNKYFLLSFSIGIIITYIIGWIIIQYLL